MQWLLIPFVIVSGVLSALQAGHNTQLGKSLGQPIAASFIVYTVGLLTLAVSAPFLGFTFSSYSRLSEAPWWMGRIIGCVLMVGGVLLVSRF